jgi:hypothetical protein
MSKVLVAPNGLEIQGTLERVHGSGSMMNVRMENGRIEFTAPATPKCGGRSRTRTAGACSSTPRETSGWRAG